MVVVVVMRARSLLETMRSMSESGLVRFLCSTTSLLKQEGWWFSLGSFVRVYVEPMGKRDLSYLESD